MRTRGGCISGHYWRTWKYPQQDAGVLVCLGEPYTIAQALDRSEFPFIGESSQLIKPFKGRICAARLYQGTRLASILALSAALAVTWYDSLRPPIRKDDSWEKFAVFGAVSGAGIYV